MQTSDEKPAGFPRSNITAFRVDNTDTVSVQRAANRSKPCLARIIPVRCRDAAAIDAAIPLHDAAAKEFLSFDALGKRKNRSMINDDSQLELIFGKVDRKSTRLNSSHGY